ncbi:MAG: methyltransferase domain-containing protein [Oscillochloris sp.]|nr:methyltransferase domain-containing protein [Oscillochloris sp.]
MPHSVHFLLMRLRGHANVSEQLPDSYFAGWQAQLTRSGLSLAGKHVVEIGSGRYARMALRMLKAGARRVTLIDLYAVSLDHQEQAATLQADCASLGLSWEDVRSRVRVIQGDLLALPPGALDEPADLVVSNAVLEHVRDPQAIYRSCYDLLRAGGATYHMVDLRDHNFHFRYPFEMLTYSDMVWKHCLDLHGGFHVNRWRAHEHLLALAKAGFQMVTYESILSDVPGLQSIQRRLIGRFRGMPARMLAIQLIYLYGRKPGMATL